MALRRVNPLFSIVGIAAPWLPGSRQMRHVPPEVKEQTAEAQATLFIRMAVVMRITDLG